MFCAIPCFWRVWDEKARDKMLLFLPVVGLETGAIWALLAWLCRYLALPALVQGAVLGAYPFVVTGFIHLDGFMDVTDAVRSCRDLARRREILKDSHVGSFAVIGVVLLALCQTALFASAKTAASLWTLALLPAVSRCGSALAVTALRRCPRASTPRRKSRSRTSSFSVLSSRFISRRAFLPGGARGRRSAAVLPGTRSRSGKRSARSTA